VGPFLHLQTDDLRVYFNFNLRLWLNMLAMMGQQTLQKAKSRV
jgi:hypothetical protein